MLRLSQIALGLSLLVMLFLICGLLTMLLWNFAMPGATGFNEIGLGQALAINTLFGIWNAQKVKVEWNRKSTR